MEQQRRHGPVRIDGKTHVRVFFAQIQAEPPQGRSQTRHSENLVDVARVFVGDQLLLEVAQRVCRCRHVVQ